MDMATRPFLSRDQLNRPKAIRALEDRIGHRFNDWRLLDQAVTHVSRRNTAKDDNERLEFLGDRVLALVITEMIMEDSPKAPPGELAVRLNALVNRPSCAKVAESINLIEAVNMARSTRKSHRRPGSTIIGNAMEAVIAAVFLDGGLDAARTTVARLWGSLIAATSQPQPDPKSRLQIWAQARGQQPPFYTLVHQEGPDHDPQFTCEVALESGETAIGRGSPKQQAEILAAEELLRVVEQHDI